MNNVGKGKKVAIIGSGISGLSTAWIMKEHGYDVTIYERYSKLGMDAESISVSLNKSNTKKGRIDVPLRVFCPNYYPNLMKLYEYVNIPIVKADYCTSNLSLFDNDHSYTHFIYRNIKLWNYISIPIINNLSYLKLAYEWLYFIIVSPYHLHLKKVELQTIKEYLIAEKYSDTFINIILLPSVAGMCTCEIDTAAKYPAPIIIDYIQKLAIYGVARSEFGSQRVVNQLSKDCKLKLGKSVLNIIPNKINNQVTVINEDHDQDIYDYVVVNTQADIACTILKEYGTKEQLAALKCFKYERSRVVVHNDISLMPKKKQDWSGVNFFVKPGNKMPMASIWMNRVQPALHKDENDQDKVPLLIQTWAPFHDPKKEHLYCDAYFTRPVVDHNAVHGMKLLEKLQGINNIYFAGSYALYAVPLLESAICSGLKVAELLGCKRPWKIPKNSPNVEFKIPKKKDYFGY